MMERRGKVYYDGTLAGTIIKRGDEYIFRYEPTYLADASLPAISLTLPRTQAEYRSAALFPFFFGLLSEGENMTLQCRTLKIDETDHFTRLLKTAATDTIGAVTVVEE